MIVEIENITKSFGSNVVLKDITARVDDSDRIGLIGSNGAGKSTLLNIMTGRLEYDSGELVVGKDKQFGFLQQNSGLNEDNTIQAEMRSVFAGLDSMSEEIAKLSDTMSKLDPESIDYKEASTRYSSLQNQYELREGYQIAAKIATVLNGMGFGQTDPQTVVGVLSGGEKTRLAICKLLLESPDLLILDEPTNHLDFPTLSWLEEYLLDYKGAILVVSHDRFFLDRICKKIWEIEYKELIEYNGNYTKYVVLKEERVERLEKEYKYQQEEIADMKDFIQKNLARASTTKRAQSRRNELEKMDILEAPKSPPKPPNIKFSCSREPVSDVLSIKDLSLSVGTEPRKRLFEHVNIDIKRGDKIAVIGINGIGKTSLLKAAMNKLPIDAGSIEWGRNVDLAYFEQGEGEMNPNNRVIDELWNDYPRENENSIRSTLGAAGLRGEAVFKLVKNLSGGERARLKFAKLMLKNANVILMDEPTNHLDLATKEVLDKTLIDYAGTLFIISHDRYLLNKFPNKIIEITADGAVVYNGIYNDYVERKSKLIMQRSQDSTKEEKPDSEKKETSGYRTKEQRRKDVEKRQRILYLEKEIETLEWQIESLGNEITLPEIAADYVVLEEKCQELEDKKQLLDQYFEEWSEIAEV